MNKSDDRRGDDLGLARSGNDARPTQLVLASVRDRLVRLAYRFLWNHDEAEDVAHEALAKAYERRSHLRDDDRWWSWLCRIVVHGCHERGRRRLRRQRHEPSLVQAAAARSIDASDEDPSDAKERVRRLLLQLPPRQQDVIVLRHLQGMSFEEIGIVLGISPATARVHAHAARESLRKWIHPSDEV